jgi:geranylgeranyl transferase type-2 subunit alpha
MAAADGCVREALSAPRRARARARTSTAPAPKPRPPPLRAAADARVWAAELALCARALDADERNFHVWSHRRWLVHAARSLRVDALLTAAAGAGGSSAAAPLDEPAPFSPAAELAFTMEKIRKNFSNYSAWHCRSVLLLEAQQAPAPAPAPAEHGSGTSPAASLFAAARPPTAGALPVAVCAAELALTARALFTEPDDQSAWLYHRWLLARLRDAASDAGAAAAAGAALAADLVSLRALQRAEPASKWPHLGLAHALQAAARAPALLAAALAAARAGAGDAAAAAEVAELLAPADGGGPAAAVRGAYAAAAERDPARAACYAHLARDGSELLPSNS